MSAGLLDMPKLGAPTADTHAHLVMLDDPAGAIERAALAGVEFIVTVADVTETPSGTFESLDGWLAEAHDRLEEWGIEDAPTPASRIIVGAHPHNAKAFDADAAALLRTLANDPRVAAIGEIGLDFHYDHSPRDDQRRAFRAQLALAVELDLPVVIHLRKAHGEGAEILREVGIPSAGCVIHCFTESPALAQQFIDMGCYISFAGPVTFKRSDALRDAAKHVPLDRILVETDCPFLAPEPNRGKTNEPSWVVYTAACIAEAREMDSADFARATYENANRLFGTREA